MPLAGDSLREDIWRTKANAACPLQRNLDVYWSAEKCWPTTGRGRTPIRKATSNGPFPGPCPVYEDLLAVLAAFTGSCRAVARHVGMPRAGIEPAT
jgi:acyl-coenzyme A synthetase/AMP-(fatty) acid ligase